MVSLRKYSIGVFVSPTKIYCHSKKVKSKCSFKKNNGLLHFFVGCEEYWAFMNFYESCVRFYLKMFCCFCFWVCFFSSSIFYKESFIRVFGIYPCLRNQEIQTFQAFSTPNSLFIWCIIMDKKVMHMFLHIVMQLVMHMFMHMFMHMVMQMICTWLCTWWGEVGRHYAAFARLTSEVSNHWAQWAEIPVPDLPLNHISSSTFPSNLRRTGLLKTADINEMQLLVLHSGKYKQRNLKLAWNRSNVWCETP